MRHHCARKPKRSLQWVSKTCAPCADGCHFAVAQKSHAARFEVDILKAFWFHTKNEPRRGPVVGNGIDDADFPILDSAVNDFKSRDNKIYGTNNFREGYITVGDVTLQDQRDLRFNTRRYQMLSFDCVAVADFHVSEKSPIIRLIDAKLLLDRFGCKTNLTSDVPAAI